MLKNFFYASILLFLGFSCQKDDPITTPEAINLELSVSVPQTGGVNLKATYSGLKLSQISESGFLLSNQPVPTLNNSIIVESKITGNQIENTVNTDLIYNGEYFVRAYIKVVSSEIYYSEEQSFVSLGSTTPIINEVTQQAHLLDTITISGNYFTTKTNNIKVLLGGESSRILVSNDSIIKCIVPVTLQTYNPTIEVKVYEKKVTFNNFTLFKPEITSVSSLNATFRDELTIIGDHFDFEKPRNKVYFGNVEATITYADRNTLKVLVPDDLESGSEQIKVSAQLQENQFSDSFKLIPPLINFVENNVSATQDITIQGAYFHPILNRNKVIFEEAEAYLLSGDTQNINTKVPYGPFPRRKAIVKVKLLDLVVEYEVELNILNKWVMVSESLPFRFRRGPKNAVVVNGVAYILAREKDNYNDDSLYLWKFNDENFTWVKVNTSVPSHGTFASGILETNGNEIFYYTSNSDNEFWKYSTESNIWSKLSDFPGARRDYSAHFSIGNDIYIGIGTDFQPYTPVSYKDFYKYDTLTDQWNQISDLPFDIWGGHRRTGMACFVINNIAYLAGGASNTGDVDAWSYNPNSDLWKQIADFPLANNESVGFQINGLGYVVGGGYIGGSRLGKSWTYSPNRNTWEESDSIIQGRGWHFSFVIGGKAFIGGGDNYSGGSPLDNLYEYIP
ncbi:IPT/TIG domain-containing protein [Flavobacteriaceae bacterium GSB9]|nr:IPT/TIG domain-containing protein [Flavobacteriaceae bacterium GSB9]